MSQIEVLLNNIRALMASAGGSILGIWGMVIFFKALFAEGGRNPVRLAVAALMIVGAGAVFTMIPTLLQAGQDTGQQVGGGGGYSMPAPARIDIAYRPAQHPAAL